MDFFSNKRISTDTPNHTHTKNLFTQIFKIKIKNKKTDTTIWKLKPQPNFFSYMLPEMPLNGKALSMKSWSEIDGRSCHRHVESWNFGINHTSFPQNKRITTNNRRKIPSPWKENRMTLPKLGLIDIDFFLLKSIKYQI